MPFIMVSFGVGLLKFGTYLSRNEPAYLKKWLMDLLEAKEAEPWEAP